MIRSLRSFGSFGSVLTFTLIVVAGCAASDGTNGSGTGGSGTTGTGGTTTSTGTAGTTGSGTGTAGTTGSAGTVGPTAGTTGSAGRGGTTGSAGATGTAGRGGAAGTASAGSGGSAATGSGGARGGTGGAAGAGASSGSGGAGLFSITVQLASAMKSTAPTTVGIVTWSISASGITSAHIDFGVDTTYGMTAPVDLTATNYRTLLLGMKPAKTYHFRIVASSGASTYTSDDQTVTTGAKITLDAHHQLLGEERGGGPEGILHHVVLDGHRLARAVHLRHRRRRGLVVHGGVERIDGRHLARAHVGGQPEHVAGERIAQRQPAPARDASTD